SDDPICRRVKVTDPQGKVTEYKYDDLGRLVKVIQTLNSGEVNEQKLETEYGYDEGGRLIWLEDAQNRRTNYEYDKVGRRITVQLPEGQRSTTTYDAVGNLKTVTDFNHETTTYIYDEQNRLLFKDLEDDADVTYVYTLNGQIAQIVDGRGTTEFNYDQQGRLIARKDPTGSYLASGFTIEYDYDLGGNVTQLRTPAGIVNYSYDEQNRLKAVTEDGQTTTYLYDRVGNLKQTQFPNSIVERRFYDELNRLELLETVRIDPATGNETRLAKFEYTLNEAGHRTSVAETLRHPLTNQLVERTVHYKYDDLYRLIEERVMGTTQTITYTYDLVGNRLTKTDASGTTQYRYNQNDRLLEEQVNGVVVTSYSYDDNGNTTTRTQNGQTTTYVWDDQNRLVEVVTPSGTIGYAYDDDNIRVSQTVGGVTTSYLVDKNQPYAQVLAEYVNGNLEASYVYGLDLIEQERATAEWFYLVDGLGSTRSLTDANGVVTDSYTYDAFGNLIDSVGGTENSYLFAGEQFDEQLEQYYLRQRYYNSSIGRFTRRDSYEGRLNEPVTLHRYLYGNANPISFIDPSGLTGLAMELSASFSIEARLAATAYLMVTTKSYQPEPLEGFGAGPRPNLPNHTGHLPDTSLESILGKLIGFGASRPNLPRNHTGHPKDKSLDDLVNYVFSSTFRGPAAGGFDWEHIMDRHAPWGRVAQQSGRKDIFYGLTEKEIQKAVKNAWKNREKFQTQDDAVYEVRRIRYQGVDQESGYVIEMWFNQNTNIVETAYPVEKI
ncbi:MAG: RHS repeat protein, partial [Desertifilum sp. SIO1I2]|nr:RHS repeat protein [Desertifilum sp. SIO1I2]